jgi:hypothetical protein
MRWLVIHSFIFKEELMSPTHLFIRLFIHIRSQAAQVETRRERIKKQPQTESGRTTVYVARILTVEDAAAIAQITRGLRAAIADETGGVYRQNCKLKPASKKKKAID